MVYLPRKMDENYVEQRMRSEIESLRESVDQRLSVLEAPTRPAENLVASPNYILNSHPEWSKAAWEHADVTPSSVPVGVAADDNRTCYNWYYQLKKDSGQDITASDGVIADGHSGYGALAAGAPVWDQVNARFFMGEASGDGYDIACPLSRDFVFPGHRYYVYFETIVTDETVDLQGAEFYCGFWDATSTEEKWIQGSNFEPTYKIYGAGGTRTLKYKILAATDGGDQILSQEVTVANAPNQMSTDNHVRLSFRGAPGFISFKIYRYDGLSYRQVGDIRNSIDLQFYDMQELSGSSVTGWPDEASNRPLAIKTTNGLVGALNQYTGHTLVVQIPTTYDRSKTANNKQWFRFGLTGPISAARGLGIRRISVSEGYGPWVRCQTDLTAPLSSPSAAASSSPVPGGAGGGGPSGGPTANCVTLDTIVETVAVINGVDVVTSVPITEIRPGMNLVCGTTVAPVKSVKHGVVQETYTIYTKRGFEVTCSADHRLIKSRFDKNGTPARRLQIGDRLLTSEEGVLAQDVIEEITLNLGETDVMTVSLPPPHLFVTNGLVSHNLKGDPEFETQSV